MQIVHMYVSISEKFGLDEFIVKSLFAEWKQPM